MDKADMLAVRACDSKMVEQFADEPPSWMIRIHRVNPMINIQFMVSFPVLHEDFQSNVFWLTMLRRLLGFQKEEEMNNNKIKNTNENENN